MNGTDRDVLDKIRTRQELRASGVTACGHCARTMRDPGVPAAAAPGTVRRSRRTPTTEAHCQQCDLPGTTRQNPWKAMSSHTSTPGTSTAEAPQDWRKRAACLDENPEMWFPVSHAPRAAEAALAICHQCPVRQACLDDELTRGGMQWGIRGGRTEHERRAMLRQRTERRPAHTCAVCGAGLSGRPPSGGGMPQRYCSDECRLTSKRRRQNAYDARKREALA